MPIDIRKGNQIFGPHTVDDLKAFVAAGEIDKSDTVIKEDGSTVTVDEFLELPQSNPLKLKRVSPGAAPPPVPSALPSALPPRLAGGIKPGFEKSAPANFSQPLKNRARQHSSKVQVSDTSFFHKAASYAVLAMLFAVAISLGGRIFDALKEPPFAALISGLAKLLFASAVPAGILALCGMVKYGTSRLLIKGLAGVILPLLVLSAATFVTKGRKLLVEKIDMVQIASAINGQGPKMVDQITRLEGATAGPGNRLTLRFTIVSFNVQQIDRVAWRTEVVPTIRKTMINSAFSDFVRNGTVVVYRYHDRNGAFVDELTFTAKDLPKK